MSLGPPGNFLDSILRQIHPSGGYVVALYSCYLDESYSDDYPVFVMGGYLLSDSAAREMEAKWQQVLDRYTVPFFHMADVNSCASYFTKLGRDGCDALAREMIGLVRSYISLGFVIATNPITFRAAGRADDVYAYSLGNCMQALATWLLVHDPGSEVSFFFESGHPSTAKGMALVEKAFAEGEITHGTFKGATSAKKGAVRLLEAADLLVWQATKHVKRRIDGRFKARGDLAELTADKHLFAYFRFDPDHQWEIGWDPAPAKENSKREAHFRKMFELPDGWGPPDIAIELDRDEGEKSIIFRYRDPPKA